MIGCAWRGVGEPGAHILRANPRPVKNYARPVFDFCRDHAGSTGRLGQDDGFRFLAVRHRKQVRIYSRGGHSWSGAI